MSTTTLFFWIYTGALLLLWIYIASSFGKDVFYNLYVNRARTLLCRPVTWVQSLAPRLSDWVAAALLFIFILLLRIVLAKASKKPLFHIIGDTVFNADLKSFTDAVAFSAASFAVILCQANLLRLALIARFGKRSTHPVIECLETVAKPLSLPSPSRSAVATALTLLAATATMIATSSNFPHVDALGIMIANPLADSALYPLKATLFAAIDVLRIVANGLILLIFVSLGGMLMRNLAVMGMANEWLAIFSRFFITRPIGVGMLDFTPLILFYLLGVAHSILIDIVGSVL
ncbi:MAG: hypothetical protein ACOX9C_11995 [Kiritimatiellia bacterium]|jgi:hypothetical protein